MTMEDRGQLLKSFFFSQNQIRCQISVLGSKNKENDFLLLRESSLGSHPVLVNQILESHGFDDLNGLEENNEDLGGINVELSLDDGGPLTISGSDCLDTFKFVKRSDENIFRYFNSVATSCTSL